MLFNSYEFIFAFLPLTLLGWAWLGRTSAGRAPVVWLIACSVAFYGLWNPLSLAIILPSIGINYALARWMQHCQVNAKPGQANEKRVGAILLLGIVFNLCFLGYFKYKNFFLESTNLLFGSDWPLVATILPLGISFITFQKIAFLVDVRAGTIKQFKATEFLIFVFFFPQLIAGPIVHYREVVPQFNAERQRVQASDLAVGLALFAMGLFKKVVLADGIAPYANTTFAAAEAGQAISLIGGWLGALAYIFQLYFDFSGYSDMAIGLARLFGIRLPANFNSPLKASSMIDFWARWHLTLTRFLTAYVYTPLVMHLTRQRMATGKPVLSRNHRGAVAFAVLVATPTMATMALSGLWHGAGLTFIVWGLLNGLLLVVNHGWRLWRPKWDKAAYERIMKPLGWLLTFTAVVMLAVFFRAHTMQGAGHLLHAMIGLDGISVPATVLSRLGSLGNGLVALGVVADGTAGTTFAQNALWVVALGGIAIGLPNSIEVAQRFEPALGFRAPAGAPRLLAMQLNPAWAVYFGVLLLAGVSSLNRISEFLYWQF